MSISSIGPASIRGLNGQSTAPGQALHALMHGGGGGLPSTGTLISASV